MTAPAPSPAPVKRSKRLYVYWGVALTLLLALGLLCWLVVLPVTRTHRALDWEVSSDFGITPYWNTGEESKRCEEANRKAARRCIRILGGPERAATMVYRYVTWPHPYELRGEQASWVLAECGEHAIPIILRGVPGMNAEEAQVVGGSLYRMRSDRAGDYLVPKLNSPDEDTRFWAAAMIRRMQHYRGGPAALSRLLNDESPRVREEAAKMLEGRDWNRATGRREPPAQGARSD